MHEKRHGIPTSARVVSRITRWLIAVAPIVVAACAEAEDTGTVEQHAETKQGCIVDQKFVEVGQPGCAAATIAAIRLVAAPGRGGQLPDPPADARNCDDPDKAVQKAKDHLQGELPGGSALHILHLEDQITKTFTFKGKVAGGGKILLGGFAEPYAVELGETVGSEATLTLQDGLTIFAEDVLLVTDGYTWPQIDGAGNPIGTKRWVPGHIRLQIWQQTKLLRGKANTQAFARTLASKLDIPLKVKGVGISGFVGVQDEGTIEWRGNSEASYSIRRIFPLASKTSPSNAVDSPADDEAAPVEVARPWAVHGFFRRVINPWLGRHNAPAVTSVQCHIKIDGQRRPVYYYDEAVADEKKRLSPAPCYDLEEFWGAIKHSSYGTTAARSGDDIATVLDPFQWMVAHVPDTFPDVTARDTWWDSIAILDGQTPPQPASLRIGGETLSWPNCQGQAPNQTCEKAGLVPWKMANQECKCVPSVGLHAGRNAFAAEAQPSIRAQETGAGRGNYGFRVIPNYTAKQNAKGEMPPIRVLHGCQCHLWLQRKNWMDTKLAVMFVPASSWDHTCDTLKGFYLGPGRSYTFSATNIRLYDCVRFEAPWPDDRANGPNKDIELKDVPADWKGGKHIGDGWMYLRSATKSRPERGRVWSASPPTFGGRLGTKEAAGAWDDVRPPAFTDMLGPPETWGDVPPSWNDF